MIDRAGPGENLDEIELAARRPDPGHPVSRHAYRACLLHMLEDPTRAPAEEAFAWHDDGLLVVEDGHVAGRLATMPISPPTLAAGTPVTALPGRLITPGFIDAHIHYPQVDVMAAWGTQLLDWLHTHTFPAELAFADRAHAMTRRRPSILDQMLRSGTTSALVFCTVLPRPLWRPCSKRRWRATCELVAGKVLMDREVPAGLLDTVETGRADSESLIRAWRGRGRLGYAITPRFAASCSDAPAGHGQGDAGRRPSRRAGPHPHGREPGRDRRRGEAIPGSPRLSGRL